MIVGPDLTLYERRRKRIIVNAAGVPTKIIPDGVSYQSWNRLKTHESDRVEWAWVLIPVGVKE